MALRMPEEYLDWRTKGLWLPGSRIPVGEFAVAHHDIFTGPFSWPLMVLHRDAVEHNLATMAEFCQRHGLEFAPHGKTTMAPKLFQAQLSAGAWGITLATANQVLTARGFGVPHIFLANELLDPVALRWLIAERERDPAFEFLCYVDSPGGIEAIRAALDEVPARREFTVVVELGHADGRTGSRSVAELLEVAKAAAAVPGIAVVGVSGYEGGLPTVDEAARYLGTVRDAADELVRAGVVDARQPVVVSAGGSQYFDAVADVLGEKWQPDYPVRTLLRSGAYVSHDDGTYRVRTPFNRLTDEGGLEAALEIWAQVTSIPEPGLALAAMGKRDAPFDEGLPIPRRVRRPDGSTVDATGIQVTKLMDQHTYLDSSAGPQVNPGDLVSFGISHPCTAFDKWRVLPLVDPDHRVVDMIHTYF